MRISRSANAILERLASRTGQSKSRVVEQALATLDSNAPREIIGRLVDVYRTHHPQISLTDDARRYLRRRNSDVRRAVITDGHLATQSAKLKALGLKSLLDVALCTDQWGREF